MAAVARAPVSLNLLFCSTVGSNPMSASKKCDFFFCTDFSLFFHLHSVSHTLGGIHKPCGLARGRGSIFLAGY